MEIREGGLYINIPFCSNKCLYCDFYSGGVRIADWEKYISSLILELKERRSEISFSPITLYIGGGTPSLMPIEFLQYLIININKELGTEFWKEITLEVNPEDVSVEKIINWKKLGINRISIGIQTLNNQELKNLGRIHTSETSITAIRNLKKEFENISVDLMFGIPGQSVNSYKATLSTIIEMAPAHISSYALMLEPGTAMTLLWEQNRIKLPTEEENIKMYDLTQKILKENGYVQYEISNYALPGYESLHNYSYWKGKPYLGLGPGAHSYDGARCRRWNPKDIKSYWDRFGIVNLETNPFYEEEILTKEEMKEEMIMTRLRTTKGLDIYEFGKLFGEKEKNILLQKSIPFKMKKLLKEENNFLSFTNRGFLLSDSVLSSLI